MLHQRGGFNSSYMTNGWMLRVRDMKVSCNVSNLLPWHFHPNRIRHMIILPVDIHSLWPSEKSTDWQHVFEKGMLRNTFRSTGCWGEHLEVFENRMLRNTFGAIWKWAADENISKCSRTGYWPGHLEVFENRLLSRTFRGIWEQAAEQHIWRYLRTGCWAAHLEVFENRLLSRTFRGIWE
jgi:hypothetical protein